MIVECGRKKWWWRRNEIKWTGRKREKYGSRRGEESPKGTSTCLYM
jgi:hypothetical protein